MKTVLTWDEKNQLLAAVIEMPPTSPEAVQLIRQSRGAGYIVWGTMVARWEARGQALPHGIALQAPWPWENPQDFQSLSWDQLGDSGSEFWLALTVLAEQIELSEEGRLPDLLAGSLIPFKASGQEGWLFLPPVREKLAALATDTERAPWQSFLHPDRKGKPSWQFFLSAMVLRYLWGRLPWVEGDETGDRQALRDWSSQKATRWLAGADPGFVSLVEAAWRGTEVPWLLWRESLSALSTQASGLATGQAIPAALEEAWRRQRRRRLFWRHRGALVGGLSAGAVIVVGFLIAFLGPILGPHPEDSWSRAQVVQGYYQAWNAMDSQTISHLVRDDGGTSVLKADHDRLASEFVLRQVRMAYEHHSPFESPKKWFADGRPVLPVGQFVRGDIDLHLKELTPFVWQAEYQQWISVPHQKETAVPRPSLILGSQVTDRLTLAKTSRGWKIVRIERVREPLP
ncbi:MAG: hypothetical protein HKM05_07965 [Spirochaetales bacterium]|nr:hypothetical protein [Spirochaetales bacterium]